MALYVLKTCESISPQKISQYMTLILVTDIVMTSEVA